LLSQFYPVFQSKQFLIVLPALAMLIVLAVRGLAPVPRLLLALMLLGYNVAGLSSMYIDHTKHDWRGVAIRISGQYRDGDVLYSNPAAGMLTLNRYLTQQIPYDGYPPEYDIIRGGWAGELVSPDAPDRLLRPFAQEYHRLWLVEFGPGFWDPDALISEWLASSGREVDDWTITGIRVRLFEF